LRRTDDEDLRPNLRQCAVCVFPFHQKSSGAAIAPSIGTPKNTSTNSGRFVVHSATRSPLRTPSAASAPARRQARFVCFGVGPALPPLDNAGSQRLRQRCTRQDRIDARRAAVLGTGH
jgi:hypothetical protein